MKTNFKFLAFSYTLLTSFFTISTVQPKEITMQKAHTVVCVLEAKSGKENDLKQILLSVAEKSRQEATNREYRLHQDKANPAQFVLYENWESAEKHALQFEKTYIKELVGQLENLLAKPYQVIFAEEL